MKRYLLAVSGGVDSVALLDMAVHWESAEIIVAHFDHGMRADSADDAAFVRQLAHGYGVECIIGKAELGPAASEDQARKARYDFLNITAHQKDAQLVTAHHADDVVETMIINMLRGTGWRGLSSLRSDAVWRPLLAMRKHEIVAYAKKHQLQWRDDPTNTDTKYLRNYIRTILVPRFGEDDIALFLTLYKEQCQLLDAISAETNRVLLPYKRNEKEYSRYLFITVPTLVALELLRTAVYVSTGKTALRPQLDRALLAVKTFRAGTHMEVGQGIELHFSRDSVIVEDAHN